MGYTENILLFDNGSDPSFEDFSDKFGIRYHREKINIYVNPAWNNIFTTPVTPEISIQTFNMAALFTPCASLNVVWAIR